MSDDFCGGEENTSIVTTPPPEEELVYIANSYNGNGYDIYQSLVDGRIYFEYEGTWSRSEVFPKE